jgi:S-adenosylmethionine:tRNA ribosyltransferase-isomerase
MTTSLESVSSIGFELPQSLEAHEPPEARGLSRDEVRLMVSYAGDDAITHTRFLCLPSVLRRGDLLVVNESVTVNAALPATRPNGERIDLHVSQRPSHRRWIVELRRLTARATAPLRDAEPGEELILPAGVQARLEEPYGGDRLWRATVSRIGDVNDYLDRNGHPIQYGYVTGAWPLSYYQTIFARERGSAEMPSAGRPFSPRVMLALAVRGVRVAPVVLHTGVSSLEAHEPPFAEYYRVDEDTARAVNETRERGGRVIAVGTTVVRTLETVAARDGQVTAGSGWTHLVVAPDRGLFAVDGLLTGFHEPHASHLAMLEALAGREHVEIAYDAALAAGYLWHEFGDVHLLLPGRRVQG